MPRRSVVVIGISVLLAIYLAALAIARHTTVETPAENDLLNKDFTEVVASDNGYMLFSAPPDYSIYRKIVEPKLKRRGINLSELTPAEEQFFGFKKAGAGRRQYSALGMLSQKFADKHGRLPRNAADIVIADGDSTRLISIYPSLVNPATGKLYGDFTKASGPLGIRLNPIGQHFYSNWFMRPGVGPANAHRWHIKVLRENGHDILLDEVFTFTY